MFDADLLVCPSDGVLFSAERERFIEATAERVADPTAVERWADGLRTEFLSGRVGPSEMWRALFPGENPAELTAALERRYRPGPLFHAVARGDRRVWLLASDRSGWLLPRLRRFELERCVERVIVSDQLGAVVPQDEAFQPLLDAARFDHVVYVDHEVAHVDAAIRLGLDARPLDAGPVSGERSVGGRRRAA